ncbi:hypothetical protein CYLTODRAFT_416990 [Cylindrobasidium torrendii FP15055 ss-10]|uniref:DNA repair protein RAD5 n=1 Tax=Cylindrobasidium torrendii FP15055 ss-10 TaxID=1314674 RepID=A0A0D7BTW1_9AGAR|nr:hypothetical protein CYLTODRAFT_416990 [Cylindrobasidium torrendii FP15055 ss-10]
MDGHDASTFFSGSDNEDDAMLVEQPDENASEPLFLDGSDDDKSPEPSEKAKGKRRADDAYDDAEYIDDDATESTGGDVPRASSVSDFDFSDHHSRHSSPDRDSPPPAKKQRIASPVRETAPILDAPTYIGEFIIPNAWSNISGKGIVKVNDTVQIRRPKLETKPKAKPKPNGLGNKQISIATMFKPQVTSAPTKKKADTIVRLYNKNGSEFGRLPQETSSWVAHLLDLKVVELRGKMTDCPERLSTGASLIVTVDVYMLPSAFSSRSVEPLKDDFMWKEGDETSEEINLRERKVALLKLFKQIGLKPRSGANVKLSKADTKLNVSKPKRKTEIVGDGEEVEVDDEEDLSKSDLDMIYQKAQRGDKDMKEMEPADTFAMTLRGYQKQALCWMQSLESGKMDVREASSMHPLWSEYTFPPREDPSTGVFDLTEEEKPFYFNPYSGELSLKFPKSERTCRGGILADEMGMGKTIMLSALIHTNLVSEEDKAAAAASALSTKTQQLRLNAAFKSVKRRSNRAPSATLIVAPTSLLSQWAEEMERSSKPGAVKVLVWHGQNRTDIEAAVNSGEDGDAEEILDSEDEEDCKPKKKKAPRIQIVITSYGVLVSEHARSEKGRSPIFDMEWLRVVLDEAHSCKNRASRTAKAVYALQARRRWAVTGTPIVNKLEDLFSLLRFINFKPWSDFTFYRSFITLPFLARDPKAIEIVQVILESILLRREKNMKDSDGKKIVDLPSKEIKILKLEFSMAERKIYDAIYVNVKKNFDSLQSKGLVGKNYTNLLAMLMRLRRAVLHPSLVLNHEEERAMSPAGDGIVDVQELLARLKGGNKDSSTSSQETESTNVFASDVLSKLNNDDEDSAECPICLDVMERPVIVSECMHKTCKDCILMYVATREEKGQEPACPTCAHAPIRVNQIIEVIKTEADAQDGDAEGPERQSEVMLRKNNFQSSTKIDALIEHLKRLRDQDPCFRAVVFSQFTTFMDLIQKALRREMFEDYRYDGTMDIRKRTVAINKFKEPSRSPKVLVISLKAGGVGLNLTNANHVFMMDCWWNAATENQAIDRVHRLGQEKTVYVTHFIINETIEGRILQIQKRKTAIVQEAFRGAAKKAEKDSVENFRIIFGED